MRLCRVYRLRVIITQSNLCRAYNLMIWYYLCFTYQFSSSYTTVPEVDRTFLNKGARRNAGALGMYRANLSVIK